MGLRDRLKERLKGVLGPPAKTVPNGPVAVVPPREVSVTAARETAVVPPRETARATVQPAAVAAPPAVVQPRETTVVPPRETTVVQPRETAVVPPPETAVAPPRETAVVPPPETAVAPSVAVATPAVNVAKVPASTPIVEAQPAQTFRFVADNADAPVRNTHIAKAREATGEGFRVHYHNADEKFDMTVVVEPGEFLLDAVERLGAVLPYSCRNGGCLSCTAKLVSGTYEMGEQYTLEEDQIERGFFLLCCSHPTSDMELITHMADEVA